MEILIHRTYSNSNGEYILNNLKKGKYILYCFVMMKTIIIYWIQSLRFMVFI